MTRQRGKAVVDDLRRRLRAARGRLLRTVATTEEELATIESHQPGALTEDASRDVTATLLSRLEGQEKRELDEIEAAQERLETGAFGLCERCRRSIPVRRLRALPTARCCLECQRDKETS